ncbi:MAG: lipid II flippase MurJ [bacterium]|nr:lipid II flippase MurJ [bacterium]
MNFLGRYIHSKPLLRDTVIVTWLSSMAKAVAAFIPFFIAAWFGVTRETDIFFFAFGMVIFIANIFAPVAESIIVPYINERKTKGENTGGFIGSILLVSGLGLFFLSALLLIIVNPVLSVLTPFDKYESDYVFYLVLMTTPMMVFLTWSGILSGTLNTYRRFIIPSLSPALGAAINLCLIFFFKNKIGIQAVAVGYVAGELAKIILLLTGVYKLKSVSLKFKIDWGVQLTQFFKVAFFQAIALTGITMNFVVDRIMASWLGEGSISVLEYAEKLYTIPVQFLCLGFLTVAFSYWSRDYCEKGIRRLICDVEKAVKFIGMASFLIVVFLVFIHKPAAKFILERGIFPMSRLPMIESAWVCYLIGFMPYMGYLIYSRGYVILKNTKVLMKCALYMNVLNVLCNYIFMRYFDVPGIALSTTFVSFGAFLYLKSGFKRISHMG